MLHTTSTYVALAALLAALGVDAHMIMNKPTPYNLNGQAPLLQTSPLGASLPFPGQGLSRVVEMNKYTAGGAPIEVQFTGAAMHKGGSCQFSVATGSTPPTDPKAWKVISSIIGGCPGETDGEGNLAVSGSDPEGRPTAKQCSSFGEKECLKTFQIPVPKELPSGVYTFAWTWFNQVGNREMYMNMAPIEISGGASADAGSTYLDSLPSIFIANIAGSPVSSCTTSPGVLGFPEPGKVGMVIEPATQGSSGSCTVPTNLQPTFEQDITSMQSGGAIPAAPPSDDSSYATPPVSSPPSQGGVYVSVAPSTPTTLATVIQAPATDAAAPPTATPAPSTETGTGAPQGSSVACPVNGALVCISDRQFGICNFGFALPQDLAAGTVCSDGKVVKRSA